MFHRMVDGIGVCRNVLQAQIVCTKGH